MKAERERERESKKVFSLEGKRAFVRARWLVFVLRKERDSFRA